MSAFRKLKSVITKTKHIYFGVDIDDNAPVPLLIYSILDYFRERGFDSARLYELPSRTHVDLLKRRFETEAEDVDLGGVVDSSVVMGLVWEYLRELVQPVFPLDMQEALLAGACAADKSNSLLPLKSSLSLLTRSNPTRLKIISIIFWLFSESTKANPPHTIEEISKRFDSVLLHLKRKDHPFSKEPKFLARIPTFFKLLIQNSSELFLPIHEIEREKEKEKTPPLSPMPSIRSTSPTSPTSPIMLLSKARTSSRREKSKEREKEKEGMRKSSEMEDLDTEKDNDKDKEKKLTKSLTGIPILRIRQLRVDDSKEKEKELFFPSPRENIISPDASSSDLFQALHGSSPPGSADIKDMKNKEKTKEKEKKSYLSEQIIASFRKSMLEEFNEVLDYEPPQPVITVTGSPKSGTDKEKVPNDKDNKENKVNNGENDNGAETETESLNGSGSWDEDPNFSSDTLHKSHNAKLFFRDFYQNLISYLYKRKSRQRKLNGVDEEQLIQHRQHETEILRLKRTKMSFSHFEQIALIGQGAFGKIFLCKKKDTGEILAIKKMRAIKLKQSRNIMVTRIKTERDVLAKSPITSPWLVHLNYSFQDDHFLYLAMEYVPGGNLRTLLNHTGPLEEKHAKFFLAEMILCVHTLHQMGYIHRDLKPENFLIDQTGHLKLADFGLSKYGLKEKTHQLLRNLSSSHLDLTSIETPRTLTRQFSFVGTPDYTAAEIIRGAGYDFTVDWWSLGIIFYELLIGLLPFGGNTAEEIFARAAKVELESLSSLGIVLEGEEEDEDEVGLFSRDAWSLILSLVCEPNKRLGKNGLLDFKDLPYFHDINWNEIRNETPPFVPQLDGEADYSYFDLPEERPDQKNTLDATEDGDAQKKNYPGLARISKNITKFSKANESVQLTFDKMPLNKVRFTPRSNNKLLGFSFRRKIAPLQGEEILVDLTTE